MEGIYKRLFPAVLQLGCDIEQVCVTISLAFVDNTSQ